MSSSPSSPRKRNVEEGQGDDKDPKKRRLVWTTELHKQFLAAVNLLNGVENAVPTEILKLMKVPGLTREQVSSHLQKYRLHLKRIGGVSPHQGNQNNSCMPTGQDASIDPLSTLNGSELQALAAAAQSLAHRLAAGLTSPVMVSNTRFGDASFGPLSTLNGYELQGLAEAAHSLAQLLAAGLSRHVMVSNTRFGDGIEHHWQQHQPQPQMSLLHGVPTGLQQQFPMSIQQQIAADVLASWKL